MMRSVLAAAAGLMAAAGAAASMASIELLPNVRVAGNTVVLGQVAHLRSTDLDLIRKLVDLPVGRAPRAGQEAAVDRASVAAWIRRAGLQESRLEWSGAAETRVVRDTLRVRGEDIARAAMEAVASKLAHGAGPAPRLHVAVDPRDIEVPAEAVRLDARPVDVARLRARLLVWVDVWAAGTHVRTIAVPVEGIQAASAGETDGASAAPQAPRATEGVRRDAAPMVTRGQWASLRTSAGVVVLESRVEVLQDGRPGDKVRVRQSGATGIVLAKVVGAGQLELAP